MESRHERGAYLFSLGNSDFRNDDFRDELTGGDHDFRSHDLVRNVGVVEGRDFRDFRDVDRSCGVGGDQVDQLRHRIHDPGHDGFGLLLLLQVPVGVVAVGVLAPHFDDFAGEGQEGQGDLADPVHRGSFVGSQVACQFGQEFAHDVRRVRRVEQNHVFGVVDSLRFRWEASERLALRHSGGQSQRAKQAYNLEIGENTYYLMMKMEGFADMQAAVI